MRTTTGNSIRAMLRAALFASMVAAISPAWTAAEKPAQLRREIAKTEDEFYALYNKVNTNKEFDMICARDQATGTKFTTRVCQPRYVLTAKQQAASERMRSAVSAADSSGPANARGPDVGNTVADGGTMFASGKDEAFRKNMLEALQRSPELQALGNKRDELTARLDAASK